MPLIKSSSKEARQKNIEEMIAAGHAPNQAVAASYANQRKYKKMSEGGILAENAEEFRNIEQLNNDSKIMLPPDQMTEEDEALARHLEAKYSGYDED